MSAEEWLLLVGLRVVDIGLLVAWLIWFFRLRDSDDDDPLDDGGGGGPEPDPGPRPRPRGPRRALPQGAWRARSHRGRPSRSGPSRRAAPTPAPLPARVRRPRTPAPRRRVA